MNELLKPFSVILAAIALLTSFAGCATTTTQTPDMLAAAGFQPYPADTPEKQKLLASLPAGQLSLITWKGKKIYVQPDVPNNRAFAGTQAHYDRYRQLAYAQRISEDQLLVQQMNRDAMMGWGTWGGSMYGSLYGRPF